MRKIRETVQNNKNTSGIWLLIVLGVMLLFLSTGLLAVRLKAMTGAEQTVTGDTDDITLDNTITLPSQYVTMNDADGSEWSLTTKTVDLFRSSYYDENGVLTVASSGEDKVIAPGTSGTYCFSMKNTGSTQLEYKLWLEKAFQVTGDDGETVTLPVQVRLSSNSAESVTWFLGSSETIWVEASALKDIESDERIKENTSQAMAEKSEMVGDTADAIDPQNPVTGKLEANQSVSYTLEWQWPYETDTDANDILLGNSENAQFMLKLIIAAEAEEPDMPSTDIETEETATTAVNPEAQVPAAPAVGPEAEMPAAPAVGPEAEETITPTEDPRVEMPAVPAAGPETEETTNSSEPGGREDGACFRWGWIAGLLFLLWLIILLWRRITITGYLQDENGNPMEGDLLRLEQSAFHKTKKAQVDEEGYFEIRRIPLGKKTLILQDEDGNELARNQLRLKRKGKLRIDDFLQIEEKKEEDTQDQYTEIDMRYRITGFQIYLHRHSTSLRMEIESQRWIARTWFKKEYTPDQDENEQSSSGAKTR
jgi:hypothetical protein